MKRAYFIFLPAILLLSSACVNKHGISAKYYSDCEEYYDLQGYYHKKCGDDDIITYKEMDKKLKETFSTQKPQKKGNVW